MVNVVTTACDLCGLPARYPVEGDGERRFCCTACVEVARLLASAPAEADADEGSSAETETVTFPVSGMWCSSCSWAIEETLARSPGVKQAEVSFLRREARVEYEPDVTRLARLKRAVRRLGYRAWLPGDKIRDEEESLYYRMLVAFVLTMNVMMISLSLYASRWLGWWESPGQGDIKSYLEIILLVGALPVVLLLGLPILKAGLVSLARGKPNIHTLIAIGAFSAFGLSVRNLIAGVDRLYFDTATVLLLLVTFGHWLELRARKQGTEAVDRLWEEIPDTATVLVKEGEKIVPSDEVPLGARVVVRPGERFPVDGVVASGTGDVDKSLLTGEPLPETTTPGDEVFAGTFSLDGGFEVITSAVGTRTAAGQIGRLLHDALWQRSPTTRLADRVAAIVVPVAVLIGLATFAFWTWRSGFETGLLNGLSVLLIACPCALGIATPLTTWLAMAKAADNGMVTRSFSAIERMAIVRKIVFDKTGTLTARPLRVEQVVPVAGSADGVLELAAAMESRSEHPVGEAIVNAARSSNLRVPSSETYVVHPGGGVSGSVGETDVVVGTRALMEYCGIDAESEAFAEGERVEARGSAVAYVATGRKVVGIIELRERVRDDVEATFADLRAADIGISILTGDSETAGRRWQDALDVPVSAGLMPADKTAAIAAFDEPVAMVGDGINDAPSLAAAAVGVSVGDAADVARSAADVVIISGELRSVPWMVGLSRISMRKVRQNLSWAFGYNVIGIGLAVAGYLPPVVAAGLMVSSSLLVTANASRLRRYPNLHEDWLAGG